MFAVMKTGGKQYTVAADDLLKVERIAGEPGEIVEISEVLMIGDGKKSTVGKPLVEGAAVAVEIVEQGRARKVIAFKKRRRQNSKRTIGHRQQFTRIRVSEILTDGAKPSKKKAAKPEAKAKAEAKAKPEAKSKPKAEKKSPAKKAEKPAKESKPAPLFTRPEGEADDLKTITGIGPAAEKQLNEQGISTFAQIAGFTDKDIARIDEAMSFSAAQITGWRDQAKDLLKDK